MLALILNRRIYTKTSQGFRQDFPARGVVTCVSLFVAFGGIPDCCIMLITA